jgi:hypothetical protein
MCCGIRISPTGAIRLVTLDFRPSATDVYRGASYRFLRRAITLPYAALGFVRNP